MKNRDYRDYLLDIFNSIDDIIKFTRNINFSYFKADKKTTYAVIKCIEIIGEATKKVPKSFKDKYQLIPWKKMAGMRNKLIHEYFGIDIKILWKTAKEDIPPLKNLIQKVLKDFGIRQVLLPLSSTRKKNWKIS